MGVFFKLGQIVKFFHGEYIAELVIEDVSFGLTSTMGEPVLLEIDLTRFDKIAIPNNKFQMAKWTRKPLAYRESNNFLIYV